MPSASAAGGRVDVRGGGPPLLLAVRVPERRRSRSTAARAGRQTGQARRHGARLRRHPLLVDPRARRQDRRDPRQVERDLVQREAHGHLPRPVRRVLRHPARDDARRRRGAAARASSTPGSRRRPRRRRPGLRRSARRRSQAPARSATASPARAASGRRLAGQQPARGRRGGRAVLRDGPRAQMPPVGKDWDDRADGRADRLPRGELLRWQLSERRSPPVPAWQRGRVASWLVTVDHKRIGILYIATAGVFFLAGGILALLIRTQLAQAERRLHHARLLQPALHDARHDDDLPRRRADPRRASRNFLVPLMIGARDMAFPRLNALSYWLFLFGGIVLLLSLLRRRAARRRAAGRAYPPLSVHSARATARTSGSSALHILTVSSLAGAINFVVTIHNMRARGMSWTRMPLFVWSIEVYASLLVARAAGAVGRADAAAARPPGRHGLLRPDRRRQPGALPARLLVLRAPRGLHHDPAGDGDHLGDPPRLRAQADLRLQGGRVLDGRDRLLLDARVGPPHVHGRHAGLPERLLHDLVDGDRRADRA